MLGQRLASPEAVKRKTRYVHIKLNKKRTSEQPGNMGLTSSTPVDLNSREAQFVKSAIEANPVVIFSKTYCPYCRTAKGIIGDMGVEAKVFELDRMTDGTILQDILGEMTKARTVPRVFINGRCIGGCSELQSLQQSGKLEQMLQY